MPKAVNSFVQQVDFAGKPVYVIVTHGGSGMANCVTDLQKAFNGTVEEPALEVYDDDVTKALPQVTEWLKGLTEVSGR